MPARCDSARCPLLSRSRPAAHERGDSRRWRSGHGDVEQDEEQVRGMYHANDRATVGRPSMGKWNVNATRRGDEGAEVAADLTPRGAAVTFRYGRVDWGRHR